MKKNKKSGETFAAVLASESENKVKKVSANVQLDANSLQDDKKTAREILAAFPEMHEISEIEQKISELQSLKAAAIETVRNEAKTLAKKAWTAAGPLLSFEAIEQESNNFAVLVKTSEQQISNDFDQIGNTFYYFLSFEAAAPIDYIRVCESFARLHAAKQQQARKQAREAAQKANLLKAFAAKMGINETELQEFLNNTKK